MNRIIFLLFLPVLLAGCAFSRHQMNYSNEVIESLPKESMATYLDYGGKIKFNDKEQLYQYSVYTGGTGSCDGGAMLYAKPKLDEFMKSNGFTSYTIVKGEYFLLPFSKCKLFIRFEK